MNDTPSLPPVPLGRTGISVSRLSFGTVYFAPGNEHLSPEAGAEILVQALQRGVNTWDTSDDYDTHPHVACALRRVPRQAAIVSSKLTAPESTLDGMLRELGTGYVDILLAHCVGLNDLDAWRERIGAWLPEKGRRVRAVGLSTHSAAVAAQAASWPEIDAILLPVNASGVTTPGARFEDGNVEAMLGAARAAWSNGKGILAMKVMGGGTLAGNPASAIQFAARLPYVHSLCIGMRNLQQVEQNLKYLEQSKSDS